MADYSDAYKPDSYWYANKPSPPPQAFEKDLSETQKRPLERRAVWTPVYVAGYLLGVLEWRTDGSTVHLYQASTDVSYYLNNDDFTEEVPLFYGTEVEALNHFERQNITHG